MDINALEKLLKSQQEQQHMQIQQQHMQMEMLLQKQEERHRIEMQELLNAVHHQNVPDLNVQANNSPTRKIKDLADSMVDFTYDPENNGIFETWYARYRSIFTTEANDLSEAMKIRLLLMKFQQSDYQRYADSILPQEPHELTLVETSIKLKKLFGYKETKFSQRHKCFNLTKEDSEDFITYSARVNKQAEKFDIVNCTPNDLKVLLFVSGLKSSKDSLILEKLLNKIDTQYVQIEAAANQAARDAIVKLTLQDLINEAERIICLKKDKSTVSDSATITDVNNVYTDGKKSSNKSKSSTNSSGKSNHFSNANSSKPSSPAGPFYPCRYCGGLHWNKDCDYRDKTCSTCKKEGHKEGYCNFLKKTRQRVNTNHVTEKDNISKNRKFVLPNINGAPIKLLLDTGSDITIISRSNWATLGKPTLQNNDKRAGSASGDQVPLLGSFPCVVKFNNKEAYVDCYVSPLQLNLFGIDWISSLDLWSQPIQHFCNKIEASNLSNLTQEIIKKFPRLFSDGLGCCTKIKAELNLKAEAKPIFRKARPVPFKAADEISTELERLQNQGVITPIDYSDSAAPIVVVKKKNGKIRICADYSTGLNDNLEPNKYPLPTPEQIFTRLAGKRIFSKIDLSDAFHQIPVDCNAQMLMTINTHRGLFKVNRLQQGIKTAPGIFQQIIDTMLSGVNTFGFIDDMIVAGKNEEDHKIQLFETLERIQQYGFKLRVDKCEFGKEEVEFCGHIISNIGIRPHPDKLQSIQDLPQPVDISQLRSFLGAINYYGKFVKGMKEIRGPLDNLLRKDTKFDWKSEHAKAFIELKNILSSNLVLTHYDHEKKIILATDASSYGMGASLLHEFPDKTLHPIMHWSGSFNSAEKDYAQGHKEARALVFGLKKAHPYIYGRHFEVHIDHKPLLAIFGSRNGIPMYTAARLQRYAIILMAYDFNIKYISTESFGYADMISRLIKAQNYLHEDQVIANVSIQNDFNEENLHCFAINTAKSLPITFPEIQKATKSSSELSQVIQLIINDSWPQKKKQISNSQVSDFFEHRDKLTVTQDCIFFGERVVIPAVFRDKILNDLHQGHPGESRTKLLASTKVYWPGINKDIEKLVKNCEKCSTSTKTPVKCTLQSWPIPSKPWSRVHLDYAGPIGVNYFLVIVDAFSKWPEVFKTNSITSAKTVEFFADTIARHGLCDVCVTDNGTQFTSKEFNDFCGSLGIKHLTTATYSPQSNGQAERFVDLLKTGLKKAEGNIDQKLREFLQSYRFIPSYNLGMKSPFQLMTGREVKSKLDLLKPRSSQECERNIKMETEFNRHHGAKWKEFQINDPIYYQLHSTNDKWKWVAGKITKKIGLVDYEAEIEGTFGERKVKAHANQLKFRHTKNELKELFDVPEDPLNFSDVEIEPIIIPQQLPEIQQNLNNSSQINHDNISNDSTNFEDALDNDEVNEDDSSNQNDDSNGNGNITPRYPVRSTRGQAPDYLRF